MTEHLEFFTEHHVVIPYAFSDGEVNIIGSSGFSVETVCKTVKCAWCLVSGDGCKSVTQLPSLPHFTRRKRNVPIASFIPTLKRLV
jgi:hypothetical protein